MYFKGTIVITDPCYIIKENPIKHPKPEDFNLPASIDSKKFIDYETPDEFAYKAAIDKYYDESLEYDDWAKCEFGDNMEVLGIHNYLMKPTICGDWSCNTYKISENPKEFVNIIERAIKDNLCEEEYGSEETHVPDYGEDIGKFCADAGLVSVFLLDEILAYNPSWAKWIEERPWCATIIENFEGEVKYYVDKVENDAHIVGEGNINFYTIQTGA